VGVLCWVRVRVLGLGLGLGLGLRDFCASPVWHYRALLVVLCWYFSFLMEVPHRWWYALVPFCDCSATQVVCFIFLFLMEVLRRWCYALIPLCGGSATQVVCFNFSFWRCHTGGILLFFFPDGVATQVVVCFGSPLRW